jgi:hypothetical protein
MLFIRVKCDNPRGVLRQSQTKGIRLRVMVIADCTNTIFYY